MAGSSPAMTSGGVSAPSPQIQFLEEIIALVVDDDQSREILDLDAPDRFHAEFGIFNNLDLLDAVLGEVGRCPADRAEIEAPLLLPAPPHPDRPLALPHPHHQP